VGSLSGGWTRREWELPPAPPALLPYLAAACSAPSAQVEAGAQDAYAESHRREHVARAGRRASACGRKDLRRSAGAALSRQDRATGCWAALKRENARYRCRRGCYGRCAR
jgi:hypothetical protein